MFDRKAFKARAKAAFKRNYWKCVLVALIVSLLTATASGSAIKNGQNANNSVEINNVPYTQEQLEQMSGDEFLGLITSDPSFDGMSQSQAYSIVGIAVAAILGIAATIGLVSGILRIFVWNPFAIGGARFFVRNSDAPAGIGEILFAFKNNYLGNVLAMFLRNLFIGLWSLLFVIPGIIKHYSWYLVPYILSDNPEMPRKEAFELSAELMKGNKWHTFVMELSFIGWEILGALTLGLLNLFYVNPYKYASFAELYKQLRYGGEAAFIDA